MVLGPALSSRQINALAAVRDNAVKSHRKYMRNSQFWVFEAEGVDITTQIKSLRLRKLIKHDWLDAARTHPMPSITKAGLATLHFVELSPPTKYAVVAPKKYKKNGAGYLLK